MEDVPEFASLTDEDKTALVDDCFNMLSSLTRVYGAEHGMKLWEEIGEALGVDLKGAVFFKMLCGDDPHTVTVTVAPSNAMKVDAVSIVKCIRNYTGYGLKESKDIWDSFKFGEKVKIKVKKQFGSHNFRNEMRNLGCSIY